MRYTRVVREQFLQSVGDGRLKKKNSDKVENSECSGPSVTLDLICDFSTGFRQKHFYEAGILFPGERGRGWRLHIPGTDLINWSYSAPGTPYRNILYMSGHGNVSAPTYRGPLMFTAKTVVLLIES